MTIEKEPSAKAEVKALRALVLAMAWQAMSKASDPAAYVAALRSFTDDTKSMIPARHADEAWPALASLLDEIETLARCITPSPPA